MEIQVGGGVFELGNPEGMGAQAVLEIQVGGGGVKKLCLPSWGCGFFLEQPIASKLKSSQRTIFIFDHATVRV